MVLHPGSSKRAETTILAVLAALAVLIPAVLGTSLGWPVWGWLLLVPVALSVPVVLAGTMLEHRRQEPLRQALRAQQEPPPSPEEEPPYPHCVIREVPVPTADADYRLLLSATVRWVPSPGAAGPPPERQQAIAIDAVLERVCTATSGADAAEFVRTGYRLETLLGRAEPDTGRHLEAWADGVVLDLAAEDAERLRRLAELRKQEELRQCEREHERNARDHLGREALSDTGNAVLWWLTQTTLSRDKIEETIALTDRLQQLSELTREAKTPPPHDTTDDFHGAHVRNGDSSVRINGDRSAETFHDGTTQPGGHLLGPEPVPFEPEEPSTARARLAEQLIESTYPASDPAGRELLADQLADLLASHATQTESQRLRRIYGPAGAAGADKPAEHGIGASAPNG